MEREKQLLADQAAALLEQKKIGDNMVKLAPEQVSTVLARLTEQRTAIDEELQRMPLRFDTLRMRERRQKLLDDLDALDKMRARFEKPVVIVERGRIPRIA